MPKYNLGVLLMNAVEYIMNMIDIDEEDTCEVVTGEKDKNFFVNIDKQMVEEDAIIEDVINLLQDFANGDFDSYKVMSRSKELLKGVKSLVRE